VTRSNKGTQKAKSGLCILEAFLMIEKFNKATKEEWFRSEK